MKHSFRPFALVAAATVAASVQFLVPGVLAPRIAHAAPSVQTDFPIFTDVGSGAYGSGAGGPATAIVSGPGGDVWMNQSRSSVIKLTPSGTASECVTSAFDGTSWGYSYGYGIAVGSDGNLWATMQRTYVTSSSSSLTAGVIARVTPTCAVSYFPTPTSGSFPYEITSGPSGYLWFTENAANKIGAINTSGTIREFAIPTASSAPTGIVAGPDGNLWFAESATDKIGRMTPSGTFTEFAVTAGSHPRDIAAGPDGKLWFTENGASAVGTMMTSGSGYVEYATPASGSAPAGITAGADGAMWFAEQGSTTAVARITTSGAITEYPNNQGYPFGITTGPDGNIWWTSNPVFHPGGMLKDVFRLPLAPCGDLTSGVTSTNDGSGLRDTPGSEQTVQINLSNCGAPNLTSATTSTTVTPPSGCPAAPAIGSFTSTLAYGQSTSHTSSFADPSCLGTYTVTSTTTVGSATVATTTTYYVVSNGQGSNIVGDFNGDGYADLAVGDGTSNVLVYYGGPNGIDARNPQIFTPTTHGMPSQLGLANPSGFGFSLVAGHFSGGMYSDLAIGVADYGYPNFSPGQEGGAVVILHGGPAGLTTQGSQFIAAPSSLTAVAGTGFGWSLATGDFNHDGFSDLAIGSPFANLGSIHRVGAVTIMYGSASGLTSAQTVITQATPGIAGPAGVFDDGFGWNMAVGDFKHNGFSDLAIAVPHEDGDVVLYGSSAGLTTAGSQYLQGAGGQAYQVAAGDFTGNGYDDLAVGQSCINMVEIHYGGASGLGSVSFKTAQEITPKSAGMPAGAAAGMFGESLAVGDIKHNGRADLVVGGSHLGPIAVWGTSTKLTTKGGAVVGGPAAAQVDVALTDLNGDGYADLVSYLPYTDVVYTTPQAAVFDGSSTGVAHSPSSSLAQQVPQADSVRGATGALDQTCGGP